MKKTPQKTQLLKVNIKYKYNMIQTTRGISNIVFHADSEYHNTKYMKQFLGGGQTFFKHVRTENRPKFVYPTLERGGRQFLKHFRTENHQQIDTPVFVFLAARCRTLTSSRRTCLFLLSRAPRYGERTNM